MPAGACPNCHKCLLEGNKIKRTAHFCGIPLFPLTSEYNMVCWECGFVSRLREFGQLRISECALTAIDSGRNFYYPSVDVGERNLLRMLIMSIAGGGTRDRGSLTVIGVKAGVESMTEGISTAIILDLDTLSDIVSVSGEVSAIVLYPSYDLALMVLGKEVRQALVDILELLDILLISQVRSRCCPPVMPNE